MLEVEFLSIAHNAHLDRVSSRTVPPGTVAGGGGQGRRGGRGCLGAVEVGLVGCVAILLNGIKGMLSRVCTFGIPGYLSARLGYPGTYPITLGVPGYLPEYAWGTRVPPSTLGVSVYALEYAGGTRVPTRLRLGYPGAYPSIAEETILGTRYTGTPGYLPYC